MFSPFFSASLLCCIFYEPRCFFLLCQTPIGHTRRAKLTSGLGATHNQVVKWILRVRAQEQRTEIRFQSTPITKKKENKSFSSVFACKKEHEKTEQNVVFYKGPVSCGTMTKQIFDRWDNTRFKFKASCREDKDGKKKKDSCQGSLIKALSQVTDHVVGILWISFNLSASLDREFTLTWTLNANTRRILSTLVWR